MITLIDLYSVEIVTTIVIY